MTAALNAANERANEIFRQEKIGYLDIGEEGRREGGREEGREGGRGMMAVSLNAANE